MEEGLKLSNAVYRYALGGGSFDFKQIGFRFFYVFFIRILLRAL